jgi:predicted transcriptional regulator
MNIKNFAMNSLYPADNLEEAVIAIIAAEEVRRHPLVHQVHDLDIGLSAY